jgi:hypothetical protein
LLSVRRDKTQASPSEGIAELVCGLDLSEASLVQWTIGRLILRSNDIPLGLASEGFVHTQHISQLLCETKDQQA